MVGQRQTRTLVLLALSLVTFWILWNKWRAPELDSGTTPTAAAQAEAHNKEGAAAIALEEPIIVDPSAPFDAKIAFHNIINEKPFSPIVIFSKSYCPYSKAAKHLLTEVYRLTPEPRIVELDLHPNGPELQDYVAGVTGRRTVPNVVILRQSRGGSDEIAALHEAGTLADDLEKWGQGLLQARRIL